MILTEADKPIYFPDIALTGPTLLGAIYRACAIAESVQGAGRPLEQQPHTEILRLNRLLQTCTLKAMPIASLPAPIIEARTGNFRDGFGRPVPLAPWAMLSEDDYNLDYETGLLSLSRYTASYFGRIGTPATEIRATYTAGFDFAVDTKDVRAIKIAVASILRFQNSPNFQGLGEVRVEGEYSVRYTAIVPGTVPDALLLPLRKYRPRSGV